jgi:hypothetical protein
LRNVLELQVQNHFEWHTPLTLYDAFHIESKINPTDDSNRSS